MCEYIDKYILNPILILLVIMQGSNSIPLAKLIHWYTNYYNYNSNQVNNSNTNSVVYLIPRLI